MRYSKFKTASRTVLAKHALEVFQVELDLSETAAVLREKILALYSKNGLQMDEYSMEILPSAPKELSAPKEPKDVTRGTEEPPTMVMPPKDRRTEAAEASLTARFLETAEKDSAPAEELQTPANWREACYGDMSGTKGPVPVVAKPGKFEKRVRLTIWPEEGALPYVPLSLNGRAIRVQRDEEVDIPYPFFEILENANKTELIKVDDEVKGRSSRRFNYSVHGIIWYKDRKPITGLKPFVQDRAAS